ncbi:MAG: sulfurtransferase TusA family protein [Deltaproteobacteria bacterium]|nr:sulfurtransferase TusA family protein [Deltaproteobacteria bacterium]
MKIDACGLSCPQPVILTLNAIKENKRNLEVLVDTNIACENVQRLAESKGYDTKIDIAAGKFKIVLTKQE